MLKLRNRFVRITIRALLAVSAFILLVFVALSVYIELNKKPILAHIKERISGSINGKISYRNADITVWRNFPYVSLLIYDVQISDSLGNTFLKLEEASCKISVLQYFRKKADIRNLSMREGFIHLLTDSTGYSNKYLIEGKKNKARKGGNIELDNATLKNVQVVLENRQKNKRFDVLFKSLHASIVRSGNLRIIDIDNNAMVNGLGFNLSKGSYLKGQSMVMNTTLRYDKNASHLSFGKSRFKISGHPYTVSGDFFMKGTGSFQLSIQTSKVPFANIQQIFTENIYNKLKTLQLQKPIDIAARLEGSLGYKTIPRVTVNWDINNNELVTPIARFSNCSLKGHFSNEAVNGLPLTDENSKVVINTFSGNWEGIAMKGNNITISNLVQPSINMSLQSSTDLRSLNDKLGLNAVRFLGGSASLVFHYAGPLQKDISIIDKLNGRLRVSNGVIQYQPRNFIFNHCNGDILFSEDLVQASNLRFNLGSNHFTVNMAGSNLKGLSASDAGKAIISCNVYTPMLNIAELKALFSAKKKIAVTRNTGKIMSVASKVDNALDNGRLKIFIAAAGVKYKNFSGSNLKGTVLFNNSDMAISGVSISHAGGNFLLDATLKENAGLNSAMAKLKLQNVDVAKVFRAFDDFGQDGISYQNLNGMLNANSNISVMINNEGSLVPGSMKGTVAFSLKNGSLINYEPMQHIKSFIFKKKNMDNISFAELTNTLQVDGYKITIPKMEIQSNALAMFVDGVYDIKKVDSRINIQLPLKSLKRDSTWVPQNIGVEAKAGTSIYLQGKNDKTGKVKIGLNTTKTLRKLL